MSDHEELKAMISEVLENQNKLSVRTQRIERKLIGDKEFHDKGLIEDFGDIKDRVVKVEKNQDRQKWFALGLGASGGGFIAVLKSWFGG